MHYSISFETLFQPLRDCCLSSAWQHFLKSKITSLILLLKECLVVSLPSSTVYVYQDVLWQAISTSWLVKQLTEGAIEFGLVRTNFQTLSLHAFHDITLIFNPLIFRYYLIFFKGTCCNY